MMSIDIHERARIHIKHRESSKELESSEDSKTLSGATKTQFLERLANSISFDSHTNSIQPCIESVSHS